ncbi:type IV pilus modification protein PilV [Pseudomonas sp. XK-1]|uniref:type IV pilus modification protein PilV n=1 Tax=Pseudomonas sp. XK-1 TaxID=3136019 RepID=UPI00311986A1
MRTEYSRARTQAGFTLIEVMVAVLVLSVGLFGMAGMHARVLNGQFDAYQRAQAMLLAQDMVNRIRANPGPARTGAYDNQELGLAEAVCGESTSAHTAANDLACWSEALRGVSVSDADGQQFGSMIGARGCIDRLGGSATSEVVLRVTVAWQGMTPTVAPNQACGANAYGAENLRRAVSIDVALAYLGE